jgi:NDP-sugar pyrophosphorylase family protein
VSSYLQANNWLLQQMADPSYTLLKYHRIQQSHIHHAATVDPRARLVGPVMVLSGAVIEGGATVIGPSVIGAESVVEAGAVVCQSVVWDRCVVQTQAVVDHCLLASHCRVDANARLHNTVHTAALRPSHGWLNWLLPARTLTVPAPSTPSGIHGASTVTDNAARMGRQRNKSIHKTREFTSA